MIRNSIKSKIIITFCFIVAFSLITSGTVAYYYCFNLLQSQYLRDETINLNRTARQIEYITEDIHKFALNIALNNNIQAYLKKNIDSGYEKYSQIQKIRNEISALEVQRDYLFNIVLIRGDDIIVSASHNKEGLDDTNYREALDEPWYKDLSFDQNNSLFSTEYELTLLHGKVKVIPYIVNVRDISSPDKKMGQLILNMDYSYIKKYMDSDSELSDNYFWVDSSNNYFFQKSANGKEINREMVNYFIEVTDKGTTASHKMDKGYLIVDRSMKNGWVFVSYILNSRIREKAQYIIYFFVLYTLAILVFTIVIIMPIIFGITRPLSKLTRAMKKVSEGDMNVSIVAESDDELGVLANGFNKMLHSLKGYIKKTVEYEKEKRDIELNLLLAQINPHFIYNTLHTVIYMASRTKNHDIVDMVRSFIGVLQDAVRINEEGLIISLKQEVDAVRQYLNIQQYRYKDRFSIVWDIDETLLECNVPRTILQPIIENSLLHGILPENRKGIIEIKAILFNEEIRITIEDNGAGMDNEVIDRILNTGEVKESDGKMRSIGIPNVLKRIRYICGDSYGLEIESKKGEYTRFVIRLPHKL